jgi:hypothetical protein
MAASTSATRIAMVAGMIGAGALSEKLPIATVAGLVGLAALVVAAFGWTQTALREA